MSNSPIGVPQNTQLRRCARGTLLALSVLLPACASDSGAPSPDGGTGGMDTGGAASIGGTTSGGTSTGASSGDGTGGTTGSDGGTGAAGHSGGVSATGGGSSGGTAGSGSAGGTGGGGTDSGGSGSGGATGGTGGNTASGGDAAGGSGGSGSVDDERSAGCGASRTLMNGRRSIQSGGTNREYILRVPDDYDNNHPYRLIIAFHWLNGNADQVANGGGSTEDPYYGLWDLAEGSTIFVAPEGLEAGWANTGDRDLALTDAILEEVQQDLCIDTNRIFATGFSYGAGMSYALACARADVFRGVALYAGAQLSGCNGGDTPIAYFHAHGVGDSVLSISQGRQLRDNFVNVNGCTPQDPPEPGQNSGTHICTSYEGCSEGYPVRWCAHGGGHNPTEKDQGQSESWVPPEAWDFISQF